VAEVSVRDVWFAYPGGVEALKGVSLEVGEGERVAVMGENGAGKTTLVKHFNGLLKPARGEVLVDGVSTRGQTVAQLSRKVGVVFQRPENQLFAETVEEEVAFALRNFGFQGEEVGGRVGRVLGFAGLERYRGRSPFSLSGGEKKRLAIACTIAWDPEVLVIDEPTIGQDYLQKRRLTDFLRDVSRGGRTVVIVTHDVEFASETCERVVLMAGGRVVGDGDAREVFRDGELLRRASLTPPRIVELLEALGDKRLGAALGAEELAEGVLEAVRGA